MQFFLNACSEIRRISKQDMSPKRSADNVTRSYFRHHCTEFLSTCCLLNLRNSVSLTILISCNFKWLGFDFYSNRKRNKCWLAAYSCNLFTYQPKGVLPEKLGGGVRPSSQNPYPIYDQNLRYSLPYLWPDLKFETQFMTRPSHQNPVSDLHYN